MSDALFGSLAGAAVALIVAIITVVGSARVARAQRKAEDNESRLRSLEDGQQHLIENLRIDYDRALARAVAAEDRERKALARAVAAERQVDQYLHDREHP